jgi:hypothetical protein
MQDHTRLRTSELVRQDAISCVDIDKVMGAPHLDTTGVEKRHHSGICMAHFCSGINTNVQEYHLAGLQTRKRPMMQPVSEASTPRRVGNQRHIRLGTLRYAELYRICARREKQQ